jgi:thiamine-phosphate pyrophosphorylase
LLGPKAIIGFSVHHVEQARNAMQLPVNYIAAGPIFPTTSKANPDPVLGLDGLSHIRQMIGDIPLVAIGGITTENACATFEAGADSVALISGLLSPPDQIEATVRTVLSLAHPKSP